MALDDYVGSLTCYYTGDWENVADRSARARGAAPQAGRQRDAESVRPRPRYGGHRHSRPREGENNASPGRCSGSALTLACQLAELNGATWKAGEGNVARWARAAPANDAALEAKARYAFAILNGLVQQAVAHRLPVKLDY